MHVREATPQDRDAIGRVHQRSIREIASEAYSQEVVEAWASPSEEGSDEADDGDVSDGDEASDAEGQVDDESADGIQPDDGKLVVAVADVDDDGEDSPIVGFGDVRFHPPEYLREPADGGVRAVYVDPDHAGDGVGTALLERLEATARDVGLDSLGLHSSVNARSFYEAHGYEVVSEVSFQFGDEVEGPAIEMRKEF